MAKWKIYVCEECMVHFALDSTNEPPEPSCPHCGDDYNVTSTGECVKGETVFDDEEDQY